VIVDLVVKDEVLNTDFAVSLKRVGYTSQESRNIGLIRPIWVGLSEVIRAPRSR
jgi:hypothetical protein